ncbi:MAG: conserved phage C-terminal domain-containing protein [Eggerthellaceae bacterium]|nr:conserved phage C-terminal domain-containing protein [Eggerthellaceae bacterium]
MNFFDSYYKVGETIRSKAARQEYFAAVIEYYYSGGQEPVFKSEQAKTGFEGVRFSLDKSLRNSSNRRKTKPEGNANESETKTARVPVSSREEEEEGLSSIEESLEERDPFDETAMPETFAYRCLGQLNEVLGTSYTSMPPRCANVLVRFDGKYTLAEVRAMLEYKRDEWQRTKFANCLTPNTLFSLDHFEQYMNQSRASAAERSEYEQYD